MRHAPPAPSPTACHAVPWYDRAVAAPLAASLSVSAAYASNHVADSLEIRTSAPVAGTVHPPGSKSITNRALVCAALAEGRSTLIGALDSDDTRLMVEALGQLGVTLAVDLRDQVIVVRGCAGEFASSPGELFVGHSGTTARFLAALLTLGHGTFRMDGTPRMRERPIGDLLDALNQLGAEARSVLGTGCPPILVRARGLAGGQTTVRGDISSQFLSGLLMVSPHAREQVEITVEGELVSKPYVRMTLAVMAAFGIHARVDGLRRFTVPLAQYQACNYEIEPDASAASYFFAAAAITGGKVTVAGLSRTSLQGDVALVDVLARMGCRVEEGPQSLTVFGAPLRGLEVDMNAISDTVPTLAAVALFATGPTTITGVRHIRHKETDRIAAVATELRKLGAVVDELDDGLRINPMRLRGTTIETYDDHRMAMAMSLVGLRVPGVIISDPGCTAKTYPRFFRDLDSICAR